MLTNNKETNQNSLSFIFDYIDPTNEIGLDQIKVKDLIMHIEDFLLKKGLFSPFFNKFIHK